MGQAAPLTLERLKIRADFLRAAKGIRRVEGAITLETCRTPEPLARTVRIGFTARPCTNRLDMDSDKARMTLGRYLVWGGEDFALQCRKIRANFIPGHLLKTLMMSAY